MAKSSKRLSTDERLRVYGYTILSRPNKGEPWWRLKTMVDGRIVITDESQSAAVAHINDYAWHMKQLGQESPEEACQGR